MPGLPGACVVIAAPLTRRESAPARVLASLAAGELPGAREAEVLVHLPGGDLVVSWKNKGEPVWMTGPATEVFEGNIVL